MEGKRGTLLRRGDGAHAYRIGIRCVSSSSRLPSDACGEAPICCVSSLVGFAVSTVGGSAPSPAEAAGFVAAGLVAAGAGTPGTAGEPAAALASLAASAADDAAA